MADNTCHAKDVVDEIRAMYGKTFRVFETMIPRSVRAVEATLAGESIFTYDPNGKVALAYDAMTQEVLNHEK